MGDPLSPAPDHPERPSPDHPERRPAARPDQGRADGAPEGSGSPRGAKRPGDLVVARPGGAMPGAMPGAVPGAMPGPVPGPVLAVDAMGGD
ncbi:MAG: hypothetical protein ACRDP5_29280, partial [Streptosporangiaceae bacterium]